MLSNLLRELRLNVNRQTLISIRNFFNSIFNPFLSFFSPKMDHPDQPAGDRPSSPSSDPCMFDPSVPSTPVSYPIKTLDDLKSRSYFNSFHFPFNKASVPLDQSSGSGGGGSLPNRPRMMVCHDMVGGYTDDDKWVQGGSNADAFAIWHWYLIDVFIYFSHDLVTLPPPCWVNAAHKHGVKVLGTFIVEWDEGKAVAHQLLSSTTLAKVYADRLSELAVVLGFDGWLINMEVELDIGLIPILQEFLSHLTKTMHSSMPGSLIIWYDSVTINGNLLWQNQLNDSNKPFFDICDGIFINYFWKEDYPKNSAAVAGNRKFDVYMGIDVFGRGTYGGGQWTTNLALDVLKKDDVSAAIFAPGWVYQTKQPPDFQTAQNRWWALVEKSWGIMQHYPKVLPFYSNFDQGHGYHISIDGRQVSDAPWNNISNQNFQPFLEFSEDSMMDTVQALVNFKDASYSGGGNITFNGTLRGDAYRTIRIFHGELLFGISPVHFTHSVKSDGNSMIVLYLEVANMVDKEKKTSVLLGDSLPTMDWCSSKFSSVLMPRQVKTLEKASGWVIQESIITMAGFTLTGIHALCYKLNPRSEKPNSQSKPQSLDQATTTVWDSSEYYAVLGHIGIKTTSEIWVFPPGSEWIIQRQDLKWKSDSQGSKTLSLKIFWTLKQDVASMFSKYNIYVGYKSNKITEASKYLGAALVEAFYISDLLVPTGTSSLKFIIQACCFDGTSQELEDSPFLQLDVEGKI